MSLLPGLTQSAPGVPIFSPASGGGGGGGANIVCSTLTAANGISSAGDVSLNANLAYPTGVVGSEATLSINLISGYVSPIAGEGNRCLSTEYQTTAGTVYGPLGVGSLEVIGITSGGVVPGVRVTSDAQGSLQLFAPSSLQCFAASNVNFSTPSLTLNGVPIGGGAVSPNLGVSTLTMGGTSNPSLFMENKTILLNQAAAVASVGSASLAWNNASSNIQIVAPSTTSVFIGTEKLTGSVRVGDSGVECSGSLSISGQPTALSSILTIAASDTNLYTLQVTDSNAALVAGVDIGLVGGRNQVYINSNAQIQNDLWVSSISKCAAATVSSLTVSSINGAAPGGGGLSNFTVPFIAGSGDGTTWTAIVDSNTGGIPVALTSTLVVSPANSYLVSYSLFGGSNSDTAQYTKLSVYTAGGNSPVIQTCPGLVSNNWLSNGFMGARSLIVSGASAIRLQAEDYSPTVSTILYFDQPTAFKVTNLGTSS